MGHTTKSPNIGERAVAPPCIIWKEWRQYLVVREVCVDKFFWVSEEKVFVEPPFEPVGGWVV